MRLFNQFLRRNIGHGAVQRLVDACKRVKQDIVRDHETVLRCLRLLLTYPTIKTQRPRQEMGSAFSFQAASKPDFPLSKTLAYAWRAAKIFLA
jgi:hypothetical protein